MKQNIICEKCATEIMARPNWENPYEMEHRKIIKGIALADFLCDNCGYRHELPKGSIVFAESIWADYGGIPYYPWESEYITIPEKIIVYSKNKPIGENKKRFKTFNSRKEKFTKLRGLK